MSVVAALILVAKLVVEVDRDEIRAGGNEGVLVETNAGTPVMIGSRRAKELEAAIARAIAERGGR